MGGRSRCLWWIGMMVVASGVAGCGGGSGMVVISPDVEVVDETSSDVMVVESDHGSDVGSDVPTPDAATDVGLDAARDVQPDVSPDLGPNMTPDVPADVVLDSGPRCSELTPCDAGTPDAGTPDVGVPDVGVPDVGTPDAGMPDVGVPDVGVPDVGTPDAGMPDVGMPDAGMPVVSGARRGSRFSTLGVRAWQSGPVRVVDDELESSGRLCGSNGGTTICVSGGFVR